MFLLKADVVKQPFAGKQLFFKICAHKNFAIFTGKNLRWSLFLIKLQAFMYFPLKIAKLFRASFFYRTPPVAASADVLLYHGVLIVLTHYIFKKMLLNTL